MGNGCVTILVGSAVLFGACRCMKETPNPSVVGARMGHAVTIKKLEKTLEGGAKVRTHPKYLWRATFVEGGKRKQKYFKTKTDAEAWAESRESEARNFGTVDSLTAAERLAVVETRQTLDGLGVTLRDAIDHAIAYHQSAQKSASVAELVDQVIEARRNAKLSDRYLRDMESRLGRFKTDFGERSAATITRDEIADWLRGLKLAPVGTNNYRRLLVVAFNDAIESKYVKENEAAKVKRVKEIETEVTVLTPQQISDLLIAADDDTLPLVAIGAFAGLRTSELERIKWADVNLAEGNIRVRAGIAKSARNRHVPISPNLKTWLTPHAKQSGNVWPKNGRKLLDASKRKAGFGNPASLTKDEDKDGVTLTPWPDNALRHSFASYRLAKDNNAGELALQMGHTDTKIIFKHYRKLVTPAEAEAFWSVMPDTENNVISISV